MSVPRAPATEGSDDPRCRRIERPPETAEDRAVVAAGWKLFFEYQAGWGVRAVWGLVGYDGMCRPMTYQVFVFRGEVFAGTISPVAMASRTDGSLSRLSLVASPGGGEEFLAAVFVRYADGDPLCCPSRTTTVHYRLEGGPARPWLVPGAAVTAPASR